MDDLFEYILHGLDPVEIRYSFQDEEVNLKLVDLLNACNGNDFVRMEDVYKLCEEDVHKPRLQRRTEDQIVEDIFGEYPGIMESRYGLELACRSIKELNFFSRYPEDSPRHIVRDLMLKARANYVLKERIAIMSTKLEPLAEVSTCSICYEDSPAGTTVLVLLNCRHSFHLECVYRWLMNKDSCPYCRHTVLLQ